MDVTDPTFLQSLTDTVQGVGVVGLLILAVIAAYKRWVVFKGEFDAMQADRDLWRTMALEHLQLANRAASVAEKATSNAAQ